MSKTNVQVAWGWVGSLLITVLRLKRFEWWKKHKEGYALCFYFVHQAGHDAYANLCTQNWEKWVWLRLGSAHNYPETHTVWVLKKAYKIVASLLDWVSFDKI